MTRSVLPLLLSAACAVCPEKGPPVQVSAVREGDGVRVQFRRAVEGTAGSRARLLVDQGRVDEVVHSPDLLTVSALWLDAKGILRCCYPYGGAGHFAAGDTVDAGSVEYVFLQAEGASVTATVPRGCIVRATLPLDVHIAPGDLPARLALPPGRTIVLTREVSRVPLLLPRDKFGVLARGDLEIVLHTATGAEHPFLVGVDADGTPTALSGFVRNW